MAGNDLALVDVSSKLEISSGARLYQNTPNPFGSRTSISFVLSARSRAEINVYDVAGRLVRQLASGDLPAGRHRIDWDGMDSRGRAAPSGTYLYELRVNGSRAETRKAIVLR